MSPIAYLNQGQEHTIDLLDPATRGAMTSNYYGAWGSGTTAPAVAQIGLVLEHPEARVLCTVSQFAANTIRYLWEMVATANRVVREFSVNTTITASANTAIIRGTLASDTPVETGDRIEFTVDHLQKDISE